MKNKSGLILWAVTILLVGYLVFALSCQAGTLQTLYFSVPAVETTDQCQPYEYNYSRDTTHVSVIFQADQGWRKVYLRMDNVPRGVRQIVYGWSMPGGAWIITSKVVERENGVDLVSCWGNKITAVSFGF